MFKITTAGRGLVYVTRTDLQPAPLPWDGVMAKDAGEGQPLAYSGPFALPPHVQESIQGHFTAERADPSMTREPWTLPLVAAE